MSQLIEGVDNEITLAFIFFTGAAAIAVPWYFFRPHSRRFSQGTRQDTNRQSSERRPSDSQAPAGTAPSNRRPTESTDHILAANLPSENVPTAPNFENNDFENPELVGQRNVSGNQEEHGDSGNISVKVKHNTSDVLFSVPKTMTLINFKRHCYAREMNEGKNVRLIYNGRILAGDHYTLDFLGINNGCVIHAQISDYQSAQRTTASVELHDLNIGHLLVPLLSLGLMLCWICVISYEELFNVTSIIMLSFLSVIFVLIAFVL